MASFLNPGAITEKKVVDTEKDALKPAYSPDSTRIAYFQDRERLEVFNRKDQSISEALPKGSFYSYTDGDLAFEWSPDGRWLATTIGAGVSQTDVILVDASAEKPPINLSNSGFFDKMPTFSAGGKVVVWASGRDGLRTADYNAAQFDFYATFLTRKLYDIFKATRDPQVGTEQADAAKPADEASEDQDDWQPQVSGLAQRTERTLLTR